MSTVLRNTFFSTVTLGLRFLSTALLFIILARALGVEEFGRFAFAISFTGIFLIFVDYGFNLLIVKEVAVSPQNVLKIVADVVNGKIILSVLSTIVIISIVKILNYPLETELIIYILWVAAIFYSFGLFFNTIFKGLNQFQYETYPSIILNSLQFLLVVTLLMLGFETISIAVSYLISRIVYFSIGLYLVLTKIGSFVISCDISRGSKVLKELLPYGVHAILATLYFQLDTVFLHYFKGDAEVGYYQAAMRIVMASMIICEVFVSAYFPVISKKIKIDREGFHADGIALNKYMFLSGGIIAAFLFLFSDIVIRFIYGEQYTHSIFIMQLLAAVIFLRFAGASYALFITAADNQRLRAISVAVSVVINIILNVIVIPKYGAVGAAIVSIITHIILDAIYIFFAITITKNTFFDSYCIKGLLALAVVVGVCLIFKQIIPLFSVFIFILLILSLMVIVALSNKEKQIIRQLFNKLTLQGDKI
jgi:O-antigen/teichoic acid export membrane protein